MDKSEFIVDLNFQICDPTERQKLAWLASKELNESLRELRIEASLLRLRAKWQQEDNDR